MIHIAIVEDEQLFVDQLKEFIGIYQEESGNEINITVFNDGEDITEDYKAEFDIILMDIQMQFMDGMTAAEHIRKKDQEVIIMFITSTTQYAIKGYEVNALDYIVKPVTYFSLSQKLDRAIEHIKSKTEHYVSIPVKDGVQKLNVADIHYIDSQSHTMTYYTASEAFHSRGKMKDLEETFEKYGFFRTHKGYLVNMKHVEGIKDDSCIINNKLLPISRRRKSEFMEAMANYMSEVI